MGQALYRRYRSKNLAEIVGQEHITRTLDNTIKRGAIGHAYLLTGPRGVGKTSIARILAHEINELAYEGERIHLDIIEIDAASNRRIDEIRDLRDKVHIAPTSAKYKVYIIDEVHMLTKEAFNALLKTLEEPPKHVIFILATTDVHKLPDTIISRTQHFTFKPIPVPKIIEHLKTISQQEGIKIEDEALNIIAEHGGGSFRDSIGLLEQSAGVADKVSAELVRQMLGVPPRELIDELLEAYYSGNLKVLVQLLSDLQVQGFIAEEISRHFSAALRDDLLNGRTQDPSRQAKLLTALVDVPASREPGTLLELTLLSHMVIDSSAVESARPSPPKALPQRPVEVEKKIDKPVVKKQEAKQTIVPDKKVSELKVSEPIKVVKKSVSTNSHSIINDETWELALQKLKKSHSTLYSVARMAEFTTDGENITLLFKFAFHKKRMESSKHKTIISEVLTAVTDRQPVVSLQLINKETSPILTTPTPEQSDEDSPVETISNIFGGAEVLES